LREKQNKPAVWPVNPINKILYNAVLSGDLKPYKNDLLTSYYDLEEFTRLGSDTEYVEIPIDPDDPTITQTETVFTPFDPEVRIRWLLLMEEWYFSRKYRRVFSRIIAIAPLYRAKVGGIELGMQPLCWLKYHDRFDKETDCSDILVK